MRSLVLTPTSSCFMTTATIIGSGPNGLSAANCACICWPFDDCYRAQSADRRCLLHCRGHAPGYRHDLASSVYPTGVVSPFFRSLPIEIPWIEPSAPCAHPLDDGIVVLLEHSIKDTVANLDAFDGRKYRSLLEPLARDFADLAADLLGPIQHISHHPLLLARFGFPALLPGASLARSRFSGVRARALLQGWLLIRRFRWKHRPPPQSVLF